MYKKIVKTSFIAKKKKNPLFANQTCCLHYEKKAGLATLKLQLIGHYELMKRSIQPHSTHFTFISIKCIDTPLTTHQDQKTFEKTCKRCPFCLTEKNSVFRSSKNS